MGKMNLPNKLTLSRVIAIPIFIVFFVLGMNNQRPISLFGISIDLYRLIAAIIFVAASITDYFDGRSARKYNSTSEYGKRLDQISDKVFSGMLGINLSILNPMFLITLLGEAIISLVNITYKVKYPDIDISSTQIGRIKE